MICYLVSFDYYENYNLTGRYQNMIKMFYVKHVGKVEHSKVRDIQVYAEHISCFII